MTEKWPMTSDTPPRIWTVGHPAAPYIWAAALALLVLGIAMIDGPPLAAEVWQRALFVAAGTLLWEDMLTLTRIRPGKRTPSDPLTWFQVYAMGGYWGSFMVIATWDTGQVLTTQLAIWGAAGLFFGSVMAFTGKTEPALPDQDRYDLSNFDDPASFERKWVLAWPVFALVLIASLAAFPPDGGWSTGYFFFTMLLTMTLATPRVIATADPRAIFLRPRTIGLALLVAALLLF